MLVIERLRGKFVPNSHRVRGFCTCCNRPPLLHPQALHRPSKAQHLDRSMCGTCLCVGMLGRVRGGEQSCDFASHVVVFCAKLCFRHRVFEVAETAPIAHSTPPTHPTAEHMHGTKSSSVGSGMGDRPCALRRCNLNLISFCRKQKNE